LLSTGSVIDRHCGIDDGRFRRTILGHTILGRTIRVVWRSSA